MLEKILKVLWCARGSYTFLAAFNGTLDLSPMETKVVGKKIRKKHVCSKEHAIEYKGENGEFSFIK